MARQMRRIAVNSSYLVIFGGVLLGSACSDRDVVADTGSEEVLTGGLRLALQTDGGQGYKLIDAVFTVRDERDAVVTTLESGADGGNQATLEAALPLGDFTIELQDGWALEALGSEGDNLAAALVSANPALFTISNHHVTELVFTFATNRGRVTLGEGEVSVGVDVVNAKTLTGCSLLDATTCPDGQTCLLADDQGETFCAAPGQVEVGQPCDSDQCVAGTQCLATGDDAGAERECTRFCDPHAGVPACDCRALGFDEDVGVCVGPALCEPDCNSAQTFTFTDTYYYNDIDAYAVYDFFSGITDIDAGSYIKFEVTTSDGSNGGAWCSANAAFYRDAYLSYAPSGGNVSSGNWERYYRYPNGGWNGAYYQGYTNYFGWSCNGTAYSWCSEWGFGGLNLGVAPNEYNYESLPTSWSSVVTISVGNSRLAACGF